MTKKIGDVILDVKNISLRFGGVKALTDISFNVREHEVRAIIGPNGAGKSTTMKMLTGLLPASSGTARLFGKEVDPRDMDTRRRVGYMSQAFSLYTELTVAQNLELHARLFHVPEAEIPARTREMIERCEQALPLPDLMNWLLEQEPEGATTAS